ncbi:hypothetical protein Aab01nite_76400 [Paractinoplanes abujensis]|uniref:Uncharacterized protein n=1 Tax=Paractinoplanes abujensis TaxID=882441 RepID=A0A7W7CPR8_9ACTN|nr:hypothetical protein [Actinoplanes abujensis]MBB4692474.1 hypothetical protein [Actinoplanes abujensis]GID24050.1 hypothetical protein Aab01nite_76400 [Actinoplanes abujensis]
MSLIARAAAALAAACLIVHVALVATAGAAAAPMLAVSIVCAVCSRDGWRGRTAPGERATMIALSCLMLLLHNGSHASHSALMPALAVGQIVLALISGPLTGPAHRPSSTRLPR